MTEWHTPSGGEATGHAAVGFVVGQRFADGSTPEFVEIEYRRDGETRTATVYRANSTPQVEYNDSDSIRFSAPHPDDPESTFTIYVDAILRARPTEPEDE